MKRLANIQAVITSPPHILKECIAADHQAKSLNKRLGAVGFGAMNGALVQGFIAGGIMQPEDVFVMEISKDRQEEARKMGINNVSSVVDAASLSKMASFADIILLGVKPQEFAKVLKQVTPFITSKHLIISIAAGISIATTESLLPENSRIVRVMPNTPSMIGCGACGFSLNKGATKEDAQVVKAMFESVGVAFEVSEANLDAVTGVSGSSPAYIYMIAEAMADGGVYAGLPRPVALSLAAKSI